MPNNAEILAQLEKLAEGKLSGEMVSCYSHSRSAVSYYADLADFPAILAAVKRWVKIEEAIKFNDGRDDCPEGIALSALDDSWGECGCTRAARLIRAALKEPA